MKSFLLSILALGLLAMPGRADDNAKHLSPERLDILDKAGVLTPAFKSAVQQFIDLKQQLRDAQADQLKFTAELPQLQEQAKETSARADALRQELAKYDHPDETDFAILQATMNDPAAKQEDQVALAQAYVWTYPASPHEADAQQYLQQVQKKIADAAQAEKDAEAAREAAHAQLVQRAQAHDLTIGEWRDFLNNMSQMDLLKYIGRPDSQQGDYWLYSGGWIKDPASNSKVGMEINFNGGRVLSVNKAPQTK